MHRCLVLTCLLLSAHPAAADVPVVTNPAKPPMIETLTLRELWRIDLDDPEGPLIGAVSAVAPGPDGTILVLDSQLVQVAVFAADGTFLRFVGHKGEGPGEVTFAFSFANHGDDRIGLLQPFPPRVVYLHGDGTPAGEFAPKGGHEMVTRIHFAAGEYVAMVERMTPDSVPGKQTRVLRLVRLDDQGRLVATYAEKEVTTIWDPPTYDEGAASFPRNEWALTASGLLVLAPDRDRYRLEFRDRDGALVRVAERPFELRRRTAADKQALARSVVYTRGNQMVDVASRFLDTDRAISYVENCADNQLRITTAYSQHDLPAGIARRWDILDEQGHWVKEQRLAAAVDWENDVFDEVGAGRWLLVRNAAAAAANATGVSGMAEGANDAPMVLVCYQQSVQ